MFRLEPNVAIQIEQAARDSLEQFGESWRQLDEAKLQENRLENLEQLTHFEGVPVHVILEGQYGDEFMQLCVRLAVIQILLTTDYSEPTNPKKPRNGLKLVPSIPKIP